MIYIIIYGKSSNTKRKILFSTLLLNESPTEFGAICLKNQLLGISFTIKKVDKKAKSNHYKELHC